MCHHHYCVVFLSSFIISNLFYWLQIIVKNGRSVKEMMRIIYMLKKM